MSNINTATRRRQWVIAGVAAAVMLAVGGSIWAYSHHQAELNQPAPKAAPNLTGSLVNTSFTEGVATAALQQQQNKTAGLERDLGMLTGTLKSQNEELKKQLTTMAEAISQLQTQQVQGGRTPNGSAATTPAAGTPPASAPVSSGQSGPAQWSINNPGSGPAAGQGGRFYPSQGQGFYPGTGTVRPGGLSRDTFTYAALTDKKTKLPWIPSGSFSEATMIEGADANASVTGQQNTSPVVITLLGEVSMPNGKTWNMDQCRVTGKMYGDISSERGEVRTKNISCILKNGKHIDMPFDGHVSFQGKVGMQFASRPDRSIEAFLKTCLSIDLKSLREFLKNTPSANLVEEKIEKTAISIRSVLTNYAKSLRYLQGLDKEGKPEFSIREWMTDAQYDSSWLFISTTARHRKAVRPLITMWLSMATLLLQSVGENSERRVWIVGDEIAGLQKIPELNETLAEGRKFGACFVIGIQNMPQLIHIYGREMAKAIFDLLNTRAYGRSPSAEVAKIVEEELGHQRRREAREQNSYGLDTVRDGISISKDKVTRPGALAQSPFFNRLDWR